MFETGLAVFIGIALILVKLPRRWMLRALKHDLAIDLSVSVLVLLVHWGTFSGVMAATVAGLLTSVATSSGKRLVGYIDGDTYYPGIFFLKVCVMRNAAMGILSRIVASALIAAITELLRRRRY